MESRKQYLIGRISDLLRARGLKVSQAKPPVGSVRADLVCLSGSSELLVECRAMSLYRASDFRAAIGDAILRFRHERGAKRGRRSSLILAFLLRRMSHKAEGDLREYAGEYLPELQWAVLAEDGSGIVHVGDHEERVSGPLFQGVVQRDSFGSWASANWAGNSWMSGGWASGSRASLFSPNNQWLFKIILLSGMDPRYWGGPQQRPRGSVNFQRSPAYRNHRSLPLSSKPSKKDF